MNGTQRANGFILLVPVEDATIKVAYEEAGGGRFTNRGLIPLVYAGGRTCRWDRIGYPSDRHGCETALF